MTTLQTPRARSNGAKANPFGTPSTVGVEKEETATARKERQAHERWAAKQLEKAANTARADARRKQIEAAKLARLVDTPNEDKPIVRLGTDPASIREISAVVGSGELKDTYVRVGVLVVVEEPSGSLNSDGDTPQVIINVDASKLARMLADSTITVGIRREKLADGSFVEVEEEQTPTREVRSAVLSTTQWPSLPRLEGIVTAPMFRPSGTLIQDPGYDADTGLIYSPKWPVKPVSDTPTVEELDTARDFITGSLLANFPFVGGSRANFLALLIAPLLRQYLRGALSPMGIIDATSPASGKSLLASIATALFSGHTRPWVRDDAELRKAITSILIDQGGAVVVLDNVGAKDTVSQPTLAALLTAKTWSDRILGVSNSVKVPNDRLWIATGNNVAIGGDMASRSVVVQLDANMPNPDQRRCSEFVLGDLEQWLTVPDNRAHALHCLLTLVRGWVVFGAPTIETSMRSFTPWASAAAGFLEWMGEEGFMGNREVATEADQDEAEFAAFYTRWRELFGDEWLTANQLIASANPDNFGKAERDWHGTFLTNDRGQLPTAKSLGVILHSAKGQFRGGLRLEQDKNSRTKVNTYQVRPSSECG